MSITANQVTMLRVLLLPIPCLLLFGGPVHKFVALLLFIAIGLTDYWDGYLARKHGPTTLGALIDPMADKIFVTAMFIPLARLEIVPVWMVLLLFVREYTVTELRSIHGSGGIQFRTSELAKYKTTIQMISGGVIILNDIFRTHWTVFVLWGILLAFSVVLAWRTYRKHSRIGLRSITFMGLVAWGLAIRCFSSYETTNLVLMGMVVLVTLASGLQYFIHTCRHLRGYLRDRFGPREWASFVGISLAFPVIYVSTLYSKEVAVWIIIGILSLEFAAGGLKNTLTTLKKSSSYIPQMTKTLFLNGAGLAGLLLILFSVPEQAQIHNALLIIVFAASLIFCLRFFYIHRDALLTNKQLPA